MIDPKANNQLRMLIQSLESRSLRKLLARANTRLVNQFLRIANSSAGEAAYGMNLKLMDKMKIRRRRGVVRRRSTGKHRPGSSKHRGVYYIKDRKKWGARVTISGRRLFLGGFKSELAAVRAIRRASK